jgi:hypothetical protein
MVLTPSAVNGPSPAIVLSLPVNGSNYFYTTTVPYVTIGVFINSRFKTPGTLTYDLDGVGKIFATHNVTSPVFLLTANTTQSLHANSSLDGQTSSTLERAR